MRQAIWAWRLGSGQVIGSDSRGQGLGTVERGATLVMARTPEFELTMDIDDDEPPRRERNNRGNGCAVFGKGVPTRVLSGERQGMAHVVSKDHDNTPRFAARNAKASRFVGQSTDTARQWTDEETPPRRPKMDQQRLL